MSIEQRRCIFLDRDGTIIEDKHYLGDPGQVSLLPGSAAAIKAVNESGWLAIVISNQSGIGRGYFDANTLTRVEEKMASILSENGARIDDYLYCPHTPEDNCECRKPHPGLLLAASRVHGVSLTASWIIGDKASDIESGRRAGCSTCMVLTGDGSPEAAKDVRPDLVAPDLYSAVCHILGIKGESEE
ncbi:MAG: HAD family hydrolase [Dehalococcoidia bacterium]|nr:HAD family hydrolase [Dehalococcoidia bacterium]